MPPIERALWAAHLPPRFLVPSILRTLPSSSNTILARPSTSLLQRRTIYSTWDPNPKLNRFNHYPGRPALTTTKTAALRRKLDGDSLPHRTGVLAVKKGMSAVYLPDGTRKCCTVLQVDRNEVVSYKRRDVHGYWAVQIGAGHRQAKNVGRPMLGHFAASGVSPKRYLAEFPVRDEEGLMRSPLGSRIWADWFVPGTYVDTRSYTKGKGFAGGMKKWGWHGQDASHGVSKTHRQMGSAGGSQGSGSRVIPGKKMPGRMGNIRKTVQNLEILKVDKENGIILVSGPVAGNKGCIVKIQDAIKKPWPELPELEVIEEAEEAAAQTVTA
ncbi:50S ribosomal protein L3 [Pseudovirgaria hyperparasitica]|uniref:Large ribosomal subunit protein uL3m n=1 Tax=Pseudovirgaria hyperparasitica TaxID=470096 RepID=A0A6A6W9W1_9PEZI|nr:50S ribosomal protein L3 [Pseudovirgaria hyperparasitica]KAF2759658.1 50S ribosomal protein L3 [Pseudovirgaria hyperparasitica]